MNWTLFLNLIFFNFAAQLGGRAPNCFEGVGHTHLPRREANPIALDTAMTGQEVVIVKNGLRACGSGGALGSAPLVQDKAYFEVKVQQSGIWSAGLASRAAKLDGAGGEDAGSWVLSHDGVFRNGGHIIGQAHITPQEGDVIGIWYDHVDLRFHVNGQPIETAVTGVRGTLFPAVFVDDGAILDLIVDNFFHPPPPGFDRILLEQSLL